MTSSSTMRILLAIFTLAGSGARAADDALIANARKEGEVVWYTTQIIDQFARPAAEAFQKKYGIKVSYVRTDSADLTLRISNEGRAGRMQADVFDGSSAVPSLKKEGLVMQWLPDTAKRLPKQYVDRDGYWVACNEFVFTPAFNSDLVPRGSEPKTWQDFLDPKWKGKMVWSSLPIASAAPGFIGMILADMGESRGMEFLRAMSKQHVAGLKVSGRQVLDQVIAGEYPIGLHTFSHQSVISAAKGAPSVWIPISPSLSVISVLSVTKDAPHPNAGKLLVDYLTSREGQILFRDSNYLPVDPEVPPLTAGLRPDGKNFRAVYMTPEAVEEDMPKWVAIYTDLFR